MRVSEPSYRAKCRRWVRLSGPATHGLAFDVAKLVGVTGGILAISLATYAYYEAPSRKWLRRQWNDKRIVIALLTGLTVAVLASLHYT